MNTMINDLKGNKIHKVWVGGLRTANNLTKQLGQTVRSRCIPSKLSLHSQWNKAREALYKVINWKANHSIRGKHHGTDRVKQNSGQSMKALELPWLKNVSWASHFGNIFMKVHDQWRLIFWIGATFTLLSLIICAFCDFFLSACLINWIGSFN